MTPCQLSTNTPTFEILCAVNSLTGTELMQLLTFPVTERGNMLKGGKLHHLNSEEVSCNFLQLYAKLQDNCIPFHALNRLVSISEKQPTVILLCSFM